jgi:hypothetical protein
VTSSKPGSAQAGHRSSASGEFVPGRPSGDATYREELTATAKLIAVSTFFLGVLIGVLFRVGMLMLRLDRPETAGAVSDDGFVIGRFTLGGTYNLFMLGGSLAAVGAAAYVAVQPHLIGPRWFRVATVGVTAMVLGGAVAIHEDGVDFTLLDPHLGVGIFLAIPLLAGLATPLVVDAVARREPGISQRLAVGLPIMLGPLAWIVTVVVLGVVAVMLPVRRAFLDWFRAVWWRQWIARVAFLTVPVVASLAAAAKVASVVS